MRKGMFSIVAIALLTNCSVNDSTSGHQFVSIPSGSFFFGSNQGSESESPAVHCKLNGFQLSETEVSNEQFEHFVKATNYVTDAEQGGGFIFEDGWKLSLKANWRMPRGEEMDRESWLNLPVVQVSYADAQAYCEWANCRLPSEIEWEYASKKGKSNVGQLNITTAETNAAQTANVRSFEKNELGIYHQSGNVWEWCSDVYNSEIHDKLSLISTTESFRAYQGRSYDPEKINATDTLRVIKGGSFLCQATHCAGYRPEARQSAEQSEAYFHIGFRIVKKTK